MGGFQYQMSTTLFDAFDESRLFLRIAAPEHKHDRLRLRRNQPHNRIRKLFPAFAAMGSGIGHLNRQNAV